MRRNFLNIMKKSSISFLLCLLLIVSIFTMNVSADMESYIPESIDSPTNVAVSANTDVYNENVLYGFDIGYTVSKSLKELGELLDGSDTEELGFYGDLYIQADYKDNDNGSWHYDSSWDTQGVCPFEGWSDALYPEENETSHWISVEDIEPPILKMSDLKDNTLYFRTRFIFVYYKQNSDVQNIISDWSDTVLIGKNAYAKEVTNVEAPILINSELKNHDDGSPYFEITTEIPESVKELHNGEGDIIQYMSCRRSGENWRTETNSGTGIHEIFSINPDDIGEPGEVNIEQGSYDIRVRYGYISPNEDVEIFSSYSNIITIGTPAYYDKEKASSWATDILDKAGEYGLITDKIKDNMKGNITREEFAEIAVKLYELYTKNIATIGDISFTDTSNPEILKAANLGLVKGIGNSKYAPENLITREQMATILLRALKVINPTADYSLDTSIIFSDDDKIESWAKEGVYYCAKTEIIKGVGDNKFDPNNNATREQSVIVCTRAYEKNN